MTGLFDDSYSTRPPDLLCNGAEVWIDNALTDYARRPDANGNRNKRFLAVIARDADGSMLRILYLFEQGRWLSAGADLSFMVIADLIDVLRDLPDEPIQILPPPGDPAV